MPELPEVETTRRGIAPHLIGQTVRDVVIREPRLRWPVPAELATALQGQRITAVERRAKYLLLHTDAGTVIIHLGMSGSLRILPCGTAFRKHDHVELVLTNQSCLRLHDPRRFGTVLWTAGDPKAHRLLAQLGPEPLGPELTGEYLYRRSRHRRRAVRDFLLDSRIVAGIGNIYANEALFLAGIRPTRAAGRISHPRYDQLVNALKEVLTKAITSGGTTLRDFLSADGTPGYFQLTLNVYDRQDEPCRQCKHPVRAQALGGRRVFFCARCQR